MVTSVRPLTCRALPLVHPFPTTIPHWTLPPLPRLQRQFHTHPSHRAIQRIESPNVITVPARLRRYLRQIKEKENSNESLHAYRRDKGPLVISSAKKETNHYLNRRYAEFNPALHLTSWGWKNNKSHGEKFTIVGHASHPSFHFDEDVAKTANAPRVFHALGLDAEFADAAVDRLGFRTPTVIQALAIPKILRGANVLVAAETGSGKTHAFLLPLLQNVFRYQKKYDYRPPKNSPRIVILSPTKELVAQMERVVETLRAVGQLPFDFTVKALRHSELEGNIVKQMTTKRDIDVAIGTPQLVANLMTRNQLKPHCVQAVVIDEVDTLMDDSFVEALVNVLGRVKLRGFDASRGVKREEEWLKRVAGEEAEESAIVDDDGGGTSTFTSAASPASPVMADHAQLVLVGATIPVDFQRRLADVVETDSLHRVTTPNLHRVSPHVRHKFHRVRRSEKPAAFDKVLEEIWSTKGHPPTMVFCNRNETVYFLQKHLEAAGVGDFECLSKFSDEDRRLEILDRFHRGYTSLLLCSDLASRGVDTSSAVNVVNFEFPNNMSDYIHRAGRVGRVGSLQHRYPPLVYNLVSQKWEVEVLWDLERSVRESKALPDVDANVKKKHVERHEDKKNVVKSSENNNFKSPEVEKEALKKMSSSSSSSHTKLNQRGPSFRKLKMVTNSTVSYEY